MRTVLAIAIKAALEAGSEIMKVYETNFNIEHKADESPLKQG